MSVLAPPRRSSQTAPARDRSRREADARAHLRVVEPARTRTGWRVMSLFALVAFCVVLFAAATFQVRLVTNQQHIEQLDRKAQLAQADYERLRLEVDQLSAPDRIVSQALALGMVEARDPTWLAPGSAALTEADRTDVARLHAYLDVKPYLQDTK